MVYGRALGIEGYRHTMHSDDYGRGNGILIYGYEVTEHLLEVPRSSQGA